ncbi:MAG: hypothetical protein FWF87_06030 [Synergistaceae bacterium]|nr:hypothetical protein [Synergistaceae bacterium]
MAKKDTINVQGTEISIITDKENENRIKIEWIPVEPKHELVIRRFKLEKDEIEENIVYMCSKNIVVEPFTFSAVRKNANFKGFHYLSSISGSVLDDPTNVNHSVDGFTFPIKKKIEEDLKDDSTPQFDQELKYVFWDEIKEKVGIGLSQVYSDVEGLKEDREKNIIALAKQYGISNEDVEESNIPFNATEEEATVKLFETQAKRFAKENIEIQKTYNELKNLWNNTTMIPIFDDYLDDPELAKQLDFKLATNTNEDIFLVGRSAAVSVISGAIALEGGVLFKQDGVTPAAPGDTIAYMQVRIFRK